MGSNDLVESVFVVRVGCRTAAPQQTRVRGDLRAHLVLPGPVAWAHLSCTGVHITSFKTCPVAFPGTLCHRLTHLALESIHQNPTWMSLTLLKLINYYPAPGDVTISLLGDAFACIQNQQSQPSSGERRVALCSHLGARRSPGFSWNSA